MDKFDRRRAGDRYSKSSEEPHHYSLSGRRSRGGGPPFHHCQENYRGGAGGPDIPHNYRTGFSSGGGRGSGGRESHRPFDSPPSFPTPPSTEGGVGGGGVRPVDDAIEGFRLAGGAGEGFGSISVTGGRGFLPVGGGVGGGFRHMDADRDSEVDEFPQMTGIGGAGHVFGSMSGRGNASEGFRPLSGRGFQQIGGGGMDPGAFRPMGTGGNDGGGLGAIGSNRDAGGFQPIGAGGSDSERHGLDDYYVAPSLTGQKRGYPFFGRERSPERGVGFAKLFVGSVPKTATDEDIRPLFEKHGRVLEVALIKDKRTGQQQGCCFVKYSSSEEADRAIKALHNQYTLPGGVGPIQVRYADGERERFGATEYKLFVGSLNRQATEKEIEEIFLPYGRVEDVYIMRDDMKQSRGCGFVKYSQREMAQAAINALNGAYTMRGCNQPLIVRFADPKRPRPGESRGGAPFGGPGFAPPRFLAPGIRSLADHGEPLQGPVSSWPHPGTQNLRPASNVGDLVFGSQFLSRSGEMAVSSAQVSMGGLPNNADNLLTGSALSCASASHLIFNQHVPQGPVQRPLQSQQNLPSLTQLQGSHMQPGQMQMMPQSSRGAPYGQASSSQQLPGQSGQLVVHQTPVPHDARSTTGQASVMANQQPPPSQQVQPLSQSPSQLAELLSQQKQTLQATFQSSQQTLNQLQQQVQQLHPSNKNLSARQGPVAMKQQPAINTHGVLSAGDLGAAASSLSSVPPVTPITTVNCNWTEHTSPDGYKYYYNSFTGESKWEKPEELTLYEQQQQNPSNQHPQVQSHPQGLLTQQDPHMQVQFQGQHQLQLHSQSKVLHQASQSSHQVLGLQAKQFTKELGYVQMPTVTGGSVNDPSQYQQGGQSSQEWTWKNKYSGT